MKHALQKTMGYLAIGALLLMPPLACGADYQGACTIAFEGDSTLHGFSGQVKSRPFTLHGPDEGTTRASQLAGKIVVDVVQMDTANGGRDKRMRKMFDALRFPLIQGELIPTDTSGTETPAPVFMLTIKERRLNVPLAVSNWEEDERGIRFDAAFDVSLKRYGLEAPSIMGMIRVADKVSVNVHVDLVRVAPSDGSKSETETGM